MARRESFQNKVLKYMVVNGEVTSREIAGPLADCDLRWGLSARQRLRDLRRPPYRLAVTCTPYRLPSGRTGYTYRMPLADRILGLKMVTWKSDGERHIIEWSLGRIAEEAAAVKADQRVESQQ